MKILIITLLSIITLWASWDTPPAGWDDIKFGIKHDKEFSKIAVLGNSTFQEFGLRFASLFTNASMKYFYDENQAQDWLYN